MGESDESELSSILTKVAQFANLLSQVKVPELLTMSCKKMEKTFKRKKGLELGPDWALWEPKTHLLSLIYKQATNQMVPVI